MKYLIIVDVQNDFVTGALGSKEAVEMYPRLLEKAQDYDGEIIFTKDTHYDNYLETQEGKYLPVTHCIKDTYGWQLTNELEQLREKKNLKVYEKPTFGSVTLANDFKELYEEGKVESIELVGLCTDICVISNALLLKANMPEVSIYVDASCCAGVTKEKHEAALAVMESCQIIVSR